MIQLGDSINLLKSILDGSVDALITDPPYGISFMNNDWDKFNEITDITDQGAYGKEKGFKTLPRNKPLGMLKFFVPMWKEAIRVLKPGAFAFVMCSPRQDVLAQQILALSEAGFNTGYSSLMWTYASGFPKSQNVTRTIDKKLGYKNSEKAKEFLGAYSGFQVKPAYEPILRVQKPLTMNYELIIITSISFRLICELELISNVNSVESSMFRVKDMDNTVLVNVGVRNIEEAIVHIGMVGNQYVQMDMLVSMLEQMKKDTVVMHWNTGLLWKSILVGFFQKENKFTTEIMIELITELKTLNFLLFQSMRENTMQEKKCNQNGRSLNVQIVEQILKDLLVKLPQPITVPIDVIWNQCKRNQKELAKNVENISTPLIQNKNFALKNVIIIPEKEKEMKLPVQNANENCQLQIFIRTNLGDHIHGANTVESNMQSYLKGKDVQNILVAMKPLSEKTYVEQAMKNGKGITWLDSGRIPFVSEEDYQCAVNHHMEPDTSYKNDGRKTKTPSGGTPVSPRGRFPANLLVSDDVLNDGKAWKSGGSVSGNEPSDPTRQIYGKFHGRERFDSYDDEGSFSRYFDLDAWYSKNVESLPDYVQRVFPFLIVPKPAIGEKNKGIEQVDEVAVDDGRNKPIDNPFLRGETLRKNIHPTVKPVKLMSYLVSIATRPKDTVLDPFMGSGTTGVACKILDRNFIGFEMKKEYFEIAERRIDGIPESVESYEVDE